VIGCSQASDGQPLPGDGTAARPRPARPPLLCLSQSFAPSTAPTAIRASKLLRNLAAQWDITVVTETAPAQDCAAMHVEVVRARRPRRLLALLRRLRLDRLLEILLWPDESIFWVIPAVLAGRRLARQRSAQAIVVFMMPYSSGLAGIALRRLTGLPLILNLDDSPTCSDMHPHFPTRLHYRMARALEDLYARRADEIVYVSQANLQAVMSRLPGLDPARFHLVRYGADAGAVASPSPRDDFEIAYVGAMSGWWSLIDADDGRLRRAYRAWGRLGRHEVAVLDQRTSSPAVIGRAILDALGEHPDWDGRVRLAIYGNPYPAALVARALADAGVDRVVEVADPVPHERVAGILARADLLFLTLPRRVDGSRGGRISAKTYEYLATDRPILAALPRGENWDYLTGKPGVWLVEPDDHAGMREAIAELAGAKFAGHARSFDRSGLREELSYANRARQFAAVIDAAIGR